MLFMTKDQVEKQVNCIKCFQDQTKSLFVCLEEFEQSLSGRECSTGTLAYLRALGLAKYTEELQAMKVNDRRDLTECIDYLCIASGSSLFEDEELGVNRETDMQKEMTALCMRKIAQGGFEKPTDDEYAKREFRSEQSYMEESAALRFVATQ